MTRYIPLSTVRLTLDVFFSLFFSCFRSFVLSFSRLFIFLVFVPFSRSLLLLLCVFISLF